jgi:hypothetical protein
METRDRSGRGVVCYCEIPSLPNMTISRKILRRCFLAAAIISVFGTLYFLSIGPVNYLTRSNREFDNTFTMIYAPIVWLHKNTTMKEPIESYLRFFERD